MLHRFFLLSVCLTAGCSHFKSGDTANSRAAWVNKTGHWLTESKRLELYRTSQRYTRMKEMLRQFDIGTLYINVGSTQLSYEGYKKQGLFTFCQRLRQDGFKPWASIPAQEWHQSDAAAEKVRIVTARLTQENKQNSQCFAGIHLDVQTQNLTVEESKRIRTLLQNQSLPIATRTNPTALPLVSPWVSEITFLQPPSKGQRSPASNEPILGQLKAAHRYQLNLAHENLQSLNLKMIEDRLKTIESTDTTSSGVAIFTLESLIALYDRESPPSPHAP